MKLFSKAALFAGAAAVALKALDNRIETTYHTIISPYIPEGFDGCKIVHLSDYHNDASVQFINEIKNEEPDFIFCTGDMADDEETYMPAIRLTEKLVKIAPCYMVTGNHDLWRTDFKEMEEETVKLGAKFLHNEQMFIYRGNDKISLCGIDDPYLCGGKNINKYLSSAAQKVSGFDGFEILLFHRANLLDEFSGCGFDLILSGHMHGGHVRIPGLGGVAAPKTSWVAGENILFPKYFGGRFENDKTTMIVNRGLGNPMIIPRIFNRPEMIVITLKRQV